MQVDEQIAMRQTIKRTRYWPALPDHSIAIEVIGVEWQRGSQWSRHMTRADATRGGSHVNTRYQPRSIGEQTGAGAGADAHYCLCCICYRGLDAVATHKHCVQRYARCPSIPLSSHVGHLLDLVATTSFSSASLELPVLDRVAAASFGCPSPA